MGGAEPWVLAGMVVASGRTAELRLDAEPRAVAAAYAEYVAIEAGASAERWYQIERIASPWLPTVWRTSGSADGGHHTLNARYWTVRDGQPWGVRPRVTLLGDDVLRVTDLVACPMSVERTFARSFADPRAMPADPFAGCVSLTAAWSGTLRQDASPERWASAALAATLIETGTASAAVLRAGVRAASPNTRWYGSTRPLPAPVGSPGAGGELRFSVETSGTDGGTQVWDASMAVSAGWSVTVQGPIGAVPVIRE